jgi:hypothetical protein
MDPWTIGDALPPLNFEEIVEDPLLARVHGDGGGVYIEILQADISCMPT